MRKAQNALYHWCSSTINYDKKIKRPYRDHYCHNKDNNNKQIFNGKAILTLN